MVSALRLVAEPDRRTFDEWMQAPPSTLKLTPREQRVLELMQYAAKCELKNPKNPTGGKL